MTGDDKKPYRIGLTGGIASGKSTVANLFDELGATVIDTDVIAREIVQPGQPALDEVRRRFGDDVINTTGELDRRALRNKIFADDKARFDLEAILHPRIGIETMRQSDALSGVYQIIVVPLLVGSALMRFVDRILVIDCDRETQIHRLLRRDSESLDQANRILAAQPSREQRLAIADDVIHNDGGLRGLREQVTVLHQSYLEGPEKVIRD